MAYSRNFADEHGSAHRGTQQRLCYCWYVVPVWSTVWLGGFGQPQRDPKSKPKGELWWVRRMLPDWEHTAVFLPCIYLVSTENPSLTDVLILKSWGTVGNTQWLLVWIALWGAMWVEKCPFLFSHADAIHPWPWSQSLPSSTPHCS